jgi:hypothetical protein
MQTRRACRARPTQRAPTWPIFKKTRQPTRVFTDFVGKRGPRARPEVAGEAGAVGGVADYVDVGNADSAGRGEAIGHQMPRLVVHAKKQNNTMTHSNTIARQQ